MDNIVPITVNKNNMDVEKHLIIRDSSLMADEYVASVKLLFALTVFLQTSVSKGRLVYRESYVTGHIW